MSDCEKGDQWPSKVGCMESYYKILGIGSTSTQLAEKYPLIHTVIKSPLTSRHVFFSGFSRYT
jgi:hypothetical protein